MKKCKTCKKTKVEIFKTMTKCLEDGCSTLTYSGYCVDHWRAHHCICEKA